MILTYFDNSQLENNTLLHEAPIDGPTDRGIAHNLQLDIARWAAKPRPTRQGLDDLLMVLNYHGHKLPKDSRTILKTPRSVDVEEKCGGKYAYVGIASVLFKYISLKPDLSTNSEIVIKVNIHGVPLWSSSRLQFWPILACINNSGPRLIGIFYGSAKPSPVSEYLADFIEEYKQNLENG